jgi:carboxyl-terminal processing protease
MIDDVGYIYLQDFSAVASSQVERELQALLNQNARAIVFDMRGNGGGLLTEAVEVADLYLPDGLVLTEEDRESVIEEFFSQTGDIGEAIPLVVLIDRGTASASEIVAGAIQDRGRAPLIGQQSFGKASVQNLQALSGGGELRITRAAWFTPGKQDLNGVGLTPDIVVEGDQFDEEGNDRVLEAALEYIDTHYPATQTTAFLFGG